MYKKFQALSFTSLVALFLSYLLLSPAGCSGGVGRIDCHNASCNARCIDEGYETGGYCTDEGECRCVSGVDAGVDAGGDPDADDGSHSDAETDPDGGDSHTIVDSHNIVDDDITIVDEFPQVANQSLNGSGIAYSVGSNLVSGPSGKSVWLAPVPTVYQEQSPVYFAFRADNIDMIENYKLYYRKPENLVIEVTIKPLGAGQTVKWEWGVYALVLSKDYAGCPPSSPILSPNDYPAGASEWLRPSASVQSDHPEIMSKAGEVRNGTNDILQAAQNVFVFMDGCRHGSPGSCDALETLRKMGGSCTNHAQLSAALLRAMGIPARVLANYPTWYRGSLATHYNVEFLVPDFDWYWMDTIASIKPLQPYQQIVVSPVNIEDEDNGMDPHRYGVALGVPYGSIRERIEGTAASQGGLDNGGYGTAGGTAPFSGASSTDLAEALKLTKTVWQKYLDLKFVGKRNPEAIAYQLKAAKSTTLKDYLTNIAAADMLY